MISTNMNLTIPTTSVTYGPDWANDLNNSLNLIDAHTHAAGSGVPITPDAMSINISLPFNGNSATGLGYVNISPQGAGILTPVNTSLYVSGVDLFYQDGNGVAIPITSGGVVNATSSGISSGTNVASFISNVLTVVQSPGVGAAIDAASYVLRYNGSYPTPSGNAIVLQAPASISGTYGITFPATTPVSNQSALVSDTAGTLSYLTPDGIGQGMTATGSNSVGVSMTSTGADAVAASRTRSTGTTVGIGGIAISAGSGSFVSTSGFATDVTGTTVTITTSGRPVRISLIGYGSLSASYLGSQGGTVGDNRASFNFVRDGGTFFPSYFISTSPDTVNNSTILTPPGSLEYVDVVGAGTYTYKLQATCWSSTSPSCAVSNCKLIAYEL